MALKILVNCVALKECFHRSKRRQKLHIFLWILIKISSSKPGYIPFVIFVLPSSQVESRTFQEQYHTIDLHPLTNKHISKPFLHLWHGLLLKWIPLLLRSVINKHAKLPRRALINLRATSTLLLLTYAVKMGSKYLQMRNITKFLLVSIHYGKFLD
jgi:hypothetical protein